MIIDSSKIPPQMGGSTLKALCHLAEAGETKATDLAEACGFSTAAATGLIDRGEKLGFMTRARTSGDRRIVVVMLTDRGRKVVEGLQPSCQTGNQDAAAA